MSLGRLVDLDKRGFVGRSALIEERRTGAKRSIVGLEIDWTEVETLYNEVGLAPQVPIAASRAAVPVYSGRWGRQIGKATTTSWSPVLKKLIALATVASAHATAGTRLQVEVTVDVVRHRVSATVVKTPFFNPPRKTQTPPP